MTARAPGVARADRERGGPRRAHRGRTGKDEDVSHRAQLLADVTIAIGYRDEEYDVDAIVADIIHSHGRVRLVDLDPQDVAATIDRHTR